MIEPALRRPTLAIVVVALVVGSAAAAGQTPASESGIVFERDGDLFAISFQGSRLVRLTNTPVWHERSPSASPDGRSIAFSRAADRAGVAVGIWIQDLAEGGSRRLTYGDDWDPAWSPDGRVVFFSRFLPQDDKGAGFEFHEWCGSLFRISAAGHSVRLLTNAPWKDSFHSHSGPSVSPDGRRIAFTDANQCSGGTTSYAARVVDLAGRVTSDLYLLRENAYFPVEPEFNAPAWSPDGKRIALVGGASLYVVWASGAGLRRLTPPRFRVEWSGAGPAWSPNGRWIVFAAYGRSDDSDRTDLYVIRADGTALRRLTRTPSAEESSPSWIVRMPHAA